ncbi:MAG: deoxyribodipyrimidine photolyase [Proteobacteria bacterium]|nr:deoxyribodipyrimidine photolyase [Pseudomonadota bacterium]
MTTTPSLRIFKTNTHSCNPNGKFVLYWMIANRRLNWNFSLQHAIEEANRLNKPLLIFEPLRTQYRWASARTHRFIIEGMKDNQNQSILEGLSYFPYVESKPGDGQGLLETLAQQSALVVTDHFPCFFLPRMVRAAANKINVRLEAVDSNGIYPLADATRDFTTAASFRRHLQKRLPSFLSDMPLSTPSNLLKTKDLIHLNSIHDKWPKADLNSLLATEGLKHLPINHNIPPIHICGGSKTAEKTALSFFQNQYLQYHTDRNQIMNSAASGLSAYLHFGHISTHQLVQSIFDSEAWNINHLAKKPNGSREGWWGMSPHAEAFLDQLITWRELGYQFTHRNPDNYFKLSSLPQWALKSIEEHKNDPRPITYTYQELDQAQTHDVVWNAAQNQLKREGIIHNYVRMLWAKKVYEWSDSAEIALERLIELNNTYAIDGRNPNSYSGIFWTFGRFDRAWGPVRSIFGKLRYMSSDSTARKLKIKPYLERYSS